MIAIQNFECYVKMLNKILLKFFKFKINQINLETRILQLKIHIALLKGTCTIFEVEYNCREIIASFFEFRSLKNAQISTQT